MLAKGLDGSSPGDHAGKAGDAKSSPAVPMWLLVVGGMAGGIGLLLLIQTLMRRRARDDRRGDDRSSDQSSDEGAEEVAPA